MGRPKGSSNKAVKVVKVSARDRMFNAISNLAYDLSDLVRAETRMRTFDEELMVQQKAMTDKLADALTTQIRSVPNSGQINVAEGVSSEELNSLFGGPKVVKE